MTQRKVVYIVSDVDKALAFEWTALHLSAKVDLVFILIGSENSALARYLLSISVKYFEVPDAKYSMSIRKWFRIFSILKSERPAVVHVHLWRAMLLGLSVAWLLGVKKRILTRHHATLHHREYPAGLKWDKLCNWLATDIIAISQNVKEILERLEQVKPSKIHIIPHGLDLNYFRNVDSASKAQLKKKYNLSDSDKPVVGVISRYTLWKGIQYIIPAFAKLLIDYPHAHMVLANAQGDYAAVVKELLKQLPRHSYTEIEFEKDLGLLYSVFDVFVHTPIDENSESFGQTYVEALAAGVPSVFSLSGIASEFIEHEKNGLVVGHENSNDIYFSLKMILQNEALKKSLVENGLLSVRKFDLSIMIDKLMVLYNAR
jgi:glycosyltransferase involved in cell wall biosynthesis